MVNTHIERVEAHDGGAFDSFCAVPDGGRGPGVLLFQEVFGVNDNMRGLAGRLADEGYLVLVPDMFWRVRPGFESPDEAGLAEGMSLAGQMDQDLAVHDMSSALGHLLGMPGCTGKVGAVGFCFGGGVVNRMAAGSPDLGAAVPYYGVQIPVEMVPAIRAPLLLQYAENDENINKGIGAYETALAANNKKYAIYIYPGTQHAFNNDTGAARYNKAAADLAWERTLAFFKEHLGAPPRAA